MQVSQAEASRRDPERGVVLVLVLVALVALLGIGGITMLSVKNELASAGASRFQDTAVYAAEAGMVAGIDWLRNQCGAGGKPLFTWAVDIARSPWAGVYGNNVRWDNPAGSGTPDPANPFSSGDSNNRAWYSVTFMDNNDVGVGGAGGGPAPVGSHPVNWAEKAGGVEECCRAPIDPDGPLGPLPLEPPSGSYCPLTGQVAFGSPSESCSGGCCDVYCVDGATIYPTWTICAGGGGGGATDDSDGIVHITAVGYGPGQSQAVIEADVQPLWGATPNACGGTITFLLRGWSQR